MDQPLSPPLRVLHVEDSLADAELIGDRLRTEWPLMEIRRVASEPALKDALKKQTWDLVLSDYSMPGFSGLAALQVVREQNSPPPLIFISGTIGEENAVEMLKQGAADYVLKDRPSRLIPAINQTLESVRLEATRQTLEAQLRRAQRLESIGMLAGGIAHDLNNMLAPIVMAADVMRQKTEDPDTQRFLDIITASARHGTSLIRQVLTFAKGAEGQKRVTRVPPLILEVAAFLTETVPPRIEISVEIPKDLWSVPTDATQFHQALMNLCVNARDAMPHGGQLLITAENKGIQVAELIAHENVNAGPFVVITVRDTGTGISPETIARIFDPFFTTKADKGTGLGLSTVLGIVKNHGGFLTVKTELNHGTAFELHFPATPDADSQDVSEHCPARSEGQGQTILVIDDEVSLRELIRSLLEAHGYKALLAPDGTTAIGLYRRHSAEVRLVLSDVSMPGLQCSELTAALRVINPEVKVVLMSGAEDGAAVAAEFRCEGFLAKPMTGNTLLLAIEGALTTSTAH